MQIFADPCAEEEANYAEHVDLYVEQDYGYSYEEPEYYDEEDYIYYGNDY